MSEREDLLSCELLEGPLEAASTFSDLSSVSAEQGEIMDWQHMGEVAGARIRTLPSLVGVLRYQQDIGDTFGGAGYPVPDEHLRMRSA